MDEATLVLNVILYVLLPLWGIAGIVDWWCHRNTEIEKTSGLHETTPSICSERCGSSKVWEKRWPVLGPNEFKSLQVLEKIQLDL